MEWTALSAIAALCMLMGAGGGYFFRRGASETAAMLKADGATIMASACRAELEILKLSNKDHEIKDAACFADLTARVSEMSRSQTAIEARMIGAIDDLSARISADMVNLTGRIDRVLEGQKLMRGA